MPELPDIEIYVEALTARIVGQTLRAIELPSPFLLRTAVPPIAQASGRVVENVRRLDKRIVLGLHGELYLVMHLMRAGRLQWLAPKAKGPGRITLGRFVFDAGALLLTEAGSKRRASLHLVQGKAAVEALHAGGIEVLDCTLGTFAAQLRAANHTLKRALTDPHLFSGIGGAYSDEILHHAGLSPLALTSGLDDAAVERLWQSTREVLSHWTTRLRAQTGGAFPKEVTAFRAGMAVHGRYGQACPVCASPVQRIVYAETETNYCARCQTGGRILADRALSRLLKASFPRDIDELE